MIRSAVSILNGGDSLVFPAKTYISAIVYADLIAERYNEYILDVLKYPELFKDDQWFRPYSEETRSIYEFLIPEVTGSRFKQTELYRQISKYCMDELQYQTVHVS